MKFTNKQKKLFWSNVEITDQDKCWNWKLSKTRDGYGKVKISSRIYGVHRVAYMMSFKDTEENIPRGLFVLHKCDNPICCNPVHLWLGTHKDNMQDMISKKRRINVFAFRFKMNNESVNQLRIDFKNGTSKHSLSNKYGISPRHIRDIIKNRCWKVDAL